MSQSPFYQPTDTYHRNIDVLGTYARTIAEAYSKKHNVPMEDALTYVKSEMRVGGKLEYKDPIMNVNLRPGPYLDKEDKHISFLNYLKLVEKKGWVICPNLVTYENPERYTAPLVRFQDDLSKQRNFYKKRMFIAMQKKDKLGASQNNQTQNNKKTYANSISGATISEHNSLCSKSMHSSLTSTCAVTTTSSNILTERIIASNRFYYTEDIAISNIYQSVRLIDTEKVKQCVEVYNLKLPTLDQVMIMVENCIKLYQFKYDLGKIKKHLEYLDAYDLAKVYFSYDLNGLIKVNPELIRQFFIDVSMLGKRDQIKPLSVEETKALDSRAISYNESLAATLVGDGLKGKVLKDQAVEDPALYGTYGFFLKNIEDNYHGKYGLLFNTFFSGQLGPNVIHDFGHSLRKVVHVSDTDSTNWTAQDVVRWFTGREEFRFDNEENFIREITAFTISNVVYHQLAKMSKNIGVPNHRLHDITMKPEFSFALLFATTKSKHYGMLTIAKEGNLYEVPELEFKGVGMKNSTSPDYVNNFAHEYWEYMLIEAITKGKKFSRREVLAQAAYIEHRTIKMVDQGKAAGLRSINIKDPASYKMGEEAHIFFKQRLWNQVFGEKYGRFETYPIPCFEIPVTLENKTDLLHWMESIEDLTVRGNLRGFVEREWKSGKKVANIGVPKEYLLNHSIPDEIRSIIDYNKVIKTTSTAMYLFYEPLGIYLPKNTKREVLEFAKDYISYEEAKALVYPKGREIMNEAYGIEP